MRHFGYLTPTQDAALFTHAPAPFGPDSGRGVLATALGATLYTPGTRTSYAAELTSLTAAGVVSAVLCLEDAIADGDVLAAEANVVAQLRAVHVTGPPPAMLFVRVRTAEQIRMLVKDLGEAVAALTGFVFPKFTAVAGAEYLDALAEARADTGLPLYGMPVLESGEVMYAESRTGELAALRDLLGARAEQVLAVRIGATDLCSLYGLRRSRDLTVYDLAIVAETICAIVNSFARGERFTVTGPVWEYFTGGERLFKPQLRTSPFDTRPDLPRAADLRSTLIRHDLDGLLREVTLDRATGIVGKTVIHPSHVRPVHALHVVTAEEYADARATLQQPGGAVASTFGNRMVEAKPHAAWARRTLQLALVFGVLRPDRTFVDLLDVEDLTA